ncbi:MAG: HAMP domain-containing histidine kinase [Verrucomicrobia bacterium]|nr:HAMP domain-containing histidine kinase [Verrucomicrobiota bacterium]
MNPPPPLERLTPRTRRAFALGVTLALLVLALTILAGGCFVRTLVRQQIIQRDAEALYATTLMQQLDARTGEPDAPPESDEQIGFDAAILASRLKGVIGIRFFDPGGQFTDSFPATVLPTPLDDAPLNAVRRFKPHSRFHPATPLSDVFIYLPQFAEGPIARVPTLEITVPLHRRDTERLAGAAQFIVEGHGIAGEYARLDQYLAALAGLAFVVAGGLLTSMLWPAFRKMERLTRDVTHRSERLQRANEELALAARTSALGAVSAHLMHGLKNPLASLSQFVHSGPDGELQQEDWQDALAAARRMQSLVEQTVEVLSDARGGPAYAVNANELAARVRDRVAPLAQNRQAELVVHADLADPLPSRAANLISLILVNLVENALQATPPGKQVKLTLASEPDWLRCQVQDQGPGFPPHLRPSLFLPCKSTRDGGSGIGLAICKQLANYLGATLELIDAPGHGCRFELAIPRAALSETPEPTAKQTRPGAAAQSLSD